MHTLWNPVLCHQSLQCLGALRCTSSSQPMWWFLDMLGRESFGIPDYLWRKRCSTPDWSFSNLLLAIPQQWGFEPKCSFFSCQSSGASPQINQAVFSVFIASVILKSLNSNGGLKSGSVLSNPFHPTSGRSCPSKKYFSSSYVTKALKNQELGWTLSSETSVLWSWVSSAYHSRLKLVIAIS